MSDIGGGNSAFDARFFAIELIGAVLVVVFLLTLFAWRDLGPLPRWPGLVLLVAALALGPGMPIYWQVAYPSANGIEGAGRLIFGGPATGAGSAVPTSPPTTSWRIAGGPKRSV